MHIVLQAKLCVSFFYRILHSIAPIISRFPSLPWALDDPNRHRTLSQSNATGTPPFPKSWSSLLPSTNANLGLEPPPQPMLLSPQNGRSQNSPCVTPPISRTIYCTFMTPPSLIATILPSSIFLKSTGPLILLTDKLITSTLYYTILIYF